MCCSSLMGNPSACGVCVVGACNSSPTLLQQNEHSQIYHCQSNIIIINLFMLPLLSLLALTLLVSPFSSPTLFLNSLTTVRVPAGTKTPAPWNSYSRNSTKSTVDPNTTIPQTSSSWWSRLPLLRRGIFGSAQ